MSRPQLYSPYTAADVGTPLHPDSWRMTVGERTWTWAEYDAQFCAPSPSLRAAALASFELAERLTNAALSIEHDPRE